MAPPTPLTVQEWAVEWLARVPVSPASREAYGFALKRLLTPLGPRFLASLEPADLQAWERELRTRHGHPLAARTRRITLDVVAMMLRGAVEAGHLPESPWRPVPRDSRGDTGRPRAPDVPAPRHREQQYGHVARPRR